MTTEPEYSTAEFVLKYLNELNAVWAWVNNMPDPEDPLYREFEQYLAGHDKMQRGM